MTLPIKNLSLVEKTLNARKNILKIVHAAKASHLGSSMSIVEMLVSMYSVTDINKILNSTNDRDRVIVSKGHAAAATYAVMHEFGLISEAELFTYHQKGSTLQGHVSHGVKYVEHSTGALGHGPSVGVGHAIYLMSKGFNSKVMVLCGDGEIQEGSVWEAVMLATTKKLENLFLLIDVNEISSIKGTEEIISTGELGDRFKGFGFNVKKVDGHNVEEISAALNDKVQNPFPTVILCETVKGKGVSFAEGEPIWHYKSLDDELLMKALEELR
jgi:transketolase